MDIPTEELLKTVRSLTADQVEALLVERKADDKALRALWRVLRARERAERRLAKEAAAG
jgi:hypothetical protein